MFTCVVILVHSGVCVYVKKIIALIETSQHARTVGWALGTLRLDFTARARSIYYVTRVLRSQFSAYSWFCSRESHFRSKNQTVTFLAAPEGATSFEIQTASYSKEFGGGRSDNDRRLCKYCC